MISRDGFSVRFTQAWLAFYTRGLPEPAGERRRAEINFPWQLSSLMALLRHLPNVVWDRAMRLGPTFTKRPSSGAPREDPK